MSGEGMRRIPTRHSDGRHAPSPEEEAAQGRGERGRESAGEVAEVAARGRVAVVEESNATTRLRLA